LDRPSEAAKEQLGAAGRQRTSSYGAALRQLQSSFFHLQHCQDTRGFRGDAGPAQVFAAKDGFRNRGHLALGVGQGKGREADVQRQLLQKLRTPGRQIRTGVTLGLLRESGASSKMTAA
jgi:hypothetical protein